MWDKRIQAKGKARQGNQAKKAKGKGKEFLSTYNSYDIESLSILTFLCKIKYSTELIKQ